MYSIKIFLYGVLCCLTPMMFTSSLFAQQTTNATITIHQKNDTPRLEKIIGEWTLVKPGNNTVEFKGDKYTDPLNGPGSYSLIVHPLKSASVRIVITKNGEEFLSTNDARITFSVASGDVLFIQITYSFLSVGTVSVVSDPPGVGFILTGPNNLSFVGKTPESFENFPVGQYTAKYNLPVSCQSPPPQSDILKSGSRVYLGVNIDCTIMNAAKDAEYQKSLQVVTLHQGNESISFEDVPLESWFAHDVFRSVELGIMSGLTDKTGKFTGYFRPSDNVNMAQLAKIAHELSGIDETEVHVQPQNTRARHTWFQQYFASAEVKGWQAYQDVRMDPNKPATRGEVVATLMQALDIPQLWPKGKMFRDVTVKTPYASSIETAATDGLVEGFTDEGNSFSKRFGPNDPITRASISRIITNAVDLYLAPPEEEK